MLVWKKKCMTYLGCPVSRRHPTRCHLFHRLLETGTAHVRGDVTPLYLYGELVRLLRKYRARVSAIQVGVPAAAHQQIWTGEVLCHMHHVPSILPRQGREKDLCYICGWKERCQGGRNTRRFSHHRRLRHRWRYNERPVVSEVENQSPGRNHYLDGKRYCY